MYVSVCMTGKIPAMLCMGLGFECGVKNDHGWVNMGADGTQKQTINQFC